MQARIVSAARGAYWLVEGWRLFRAAPLGWVSLVFAYVLLTNLLTLVPVLGIFAALLVVPGLSVGFMAAARAAAKGGKVELAMLLEGFREQPRPQIGLGVAYLACSALVFGAMALADGEGSLRAMLTGTRKPQEIPMEDVLAPLLVAAAAYTPVMMLFWFAPPLAAWHSAGAAKALFFSFFACLMNWRAFLAYGALTALVAVVFPAVLLTGVMLLSGGALRLQVMSLVFPLLIVLLPTLFASFYASYRDVFGADEIL
jgi:hypothetical protein